MTEAQKRSLERIILKYGVESQLDKTVEKCAELIQACEKIKRKLSDRTIGALVDEIADVEVMLWQLKYFFRIENSVRERVEYKINRQIGRMADETLR